MFAAETQAVNAVLLLRVVNGIPSDTTSPTTVPVIVIFRVEFVAAAVAGKSSVVVLLSSLTIAVPPPMAKVPVTAVLPVTPNVPAIVVFPVEAVTLNLLVLTDRSDVTPNVPETVALPVTLSGEFTLTLEEVMFNRAIPLVASAICCKAGE